MKIQYHRCWSCVSGHHFDVLTVHTWMDEADADAAGVDWPLCALDVEATRCACQCGGGPGACVQGEWRPVVDAPPL